jgi:hypothetical protein
MYCRQYIRPLLFLFVFCLCLCLIAFYDVIVQNIHRRRFAQTIYFFADFRMLSDILLHHRLSFRRSRQRTMDPLHTSICSCCIMGLACAENPSSQPLFADPRMRRKSEPAAVVQQALLTACCVRPLLRTIHPLHAEPHIR